nr:MAG TPA: hypothetical protein [Caudoviricetes sp.]
MYIITSMVWKENAYAFSFNSIFTMVKVLYP